MNNQKSIKLVFKGLTIFGVFIQLYGQNYVVTDKIRELEFLIGNWEVTETLFPGNYNEYQEKGNRTCRYTLYESAIQCESFTTVSTSGKKRSYIFIINYNSSGDYYNVTTIASDYHRQIEYRWYLDNSRKKISVVSIHDEDTHRFFRSEIDFNNESQIKWVGWRSIFKGDEEWQLIFDERAVKSVNDS